MKKMTKEASRFIVSYYLDRTVPPSRYSEILFSQLMNMPYFGGLNHPSQFVIHEISVLEGHTNNSQTKKSEQFKRPLLKGFWKKHFIYRSILEKTPKRACGLNDLKSKNFENMVIPILKKHENIEYVSHEEYCKKLASELTTKIMEKVSDRRAKKKNTGDYLVYYPHEGQNYYLCIGRKHHLR